MCVSQEKKSDKEREREREREKKKKKIQKETWDERKKQKPSHNDA